MNTTKNKITLVSFGSGSSGNSYWLSTPEGTIMIDGGVGMNTLKSHARCYGLSLNKVQALFITHDHNDHIKSVGRLGNKFNIPIYATDMVVNSPRMKRICSDIHKFAHIIEKQQPVEVGPFKVIAFEVPHDGLDNVGYQIEVAGKIFCFVTDIGNITPLASDFMSRANYLILESNYDEEMLLTGKYSEQLKRRIIGSNGHLSNRESAEFIASRVGGPLKKVWLCHMSEDNNRPDIAMKAVVDALNVYGYQLGVEVEVEPLQRKLPMLFEIPLEEENKELC